MRLLMTDVEANGGQSSGPHGNGLPGTNRPSDQAIHQAQRILGGNAPVDLEAELLKLLDIIDMDDSPYPVKYNLRNKQGQTMLHFASMLGLSRFTAALLARGASPEVHDKGGYTPIHFAALHDHPDLVRRLVLTRADTSARS